MLSGTPGGRRILVFYASYRVACALLERIGTHPKFFALGAKGQIQGLHPSPTPLSLGELHVDFSTLVVTLLGG